MDGFRRIVGLAAGVAISALSAPAHAETDDGVTFEFAVSAEETDLMTLEYGQFGDDADARPLVGQDESASGTRFDIGASGFALSPFGVDGEVYLRGTYRDVSGDFSESFANAGDWLLAPTGLVGFDEAQSIGDGGGGTIVTARDIDQRESEIAAGFALTDREQFTPRIELSFRRGEIDQTVSVNRVGVTPILEEFATDTSSLTSDCAELGLGIAKTMDIAANWSFVADASAGVGYCSHDLEGQFNFVDGVFPYTTTFDDSLDGVSARGSLSAGLIWRLSDNVGIGFDARAGMESDAPYIAYPTYEITNGNVESFGTIHIETESRVSYGARLSLRLALN